mgnify:CR=1 FL=1
MKTKLKKKAGPDKIFPEFLRNLGLSAKRSVLELYNNIWNGKYSIPSEWRKAIVIPILKPNKPPHEISYRPISLTSVLAKVMERMVMARLNWFLESQELLTVEQAGFRPNLSTAYQLTKFTQDIKESFNNKESILALFIDFQNAYDKVWRNKLIWKLQNLGIKDNMLRWCKSFITQRWISTEHNKQRSPYKQTRTGLPQGAVSSTTLFNVYVNDLPNELKSIKNIKCAMFADDIVIWTTCKNSARNHNQQLENTINKAAEKLQMWSLENNMEISIPKTNYQYFSLKHKNEEFNIKISNQQINKSTCTKYLGMHLDNKLNWAQHVEKIEEKIFRKGHILKRLAGTKWGSPLDTLNQTYKIYMKPILTYGAEVLITSNVHKQLLYPE